MESTQQVSDRSLETVEVNRSVLEDIIRNTEKGVQKHALIPKTFTEAQQYAEYIWRSNACPTIYNKDKRQHIKISQDDVFMIIQSGLELGVRPLQALTGIMIVNGRCSVWGDLALALVLRSGLVEEWYERPAKEALAKGEGYFKIRRKGNKNFTEVYYSVQDAKTAELWGRSGPWTTNPGRMLQMRARAFALRDAFADVLKGLAIVEEQMDNTPIIDAVMEATVQMPRRKSETDGNGGSVFPPAPAPEPQPMPAAVAPPTLEPEKPEPKKEPAKPAEQPKPMDPDKPTSVEKIASVEQKKYTDKKTTQEKTYYVLHTPEGVKYATFSETAAVNAQTAQKQGTEVLIQYHEDKAGRGRVADMIEPAEYGAESESDGESPAPSEA